jgi:uncharacterized protein (TIGR01777 family)
MTMKVAITGATGLIGGALRSSLMSDGHEVITVTRTPRSPDQLGWSPSEGTIDAAALEGLDAVVHLAGAPIGEKRWTDEVKKELLTSRVDGTALIARTLAALDAPPAVLLSGSAIGYYGDTGDEVIDESHPAGSDFLADLCVHWEAAAQPAADAGITTSRLRTGIVLSTEGGALARQLPFFRWGLGGKSGSGRQYMSWISVRDQVAAMEWLISHPVDGPVNLTAPHPVTNSEFARTLGATLHRPTTIIPMIGPRLLLGRELADSLLLTSARIRPAALEAAGYEFEQPKLDTALSDLLR